VYSSLDETSQYERDVMPKKKAATQEDVVLDIATQFGGGENALDRALPTPERIEDRIKSPHIRVFVKKLPHYGNLPNLKPATYGSVGIDLFAALDEPICLNTLGVRAIIPTGIAIALPVGFEAQIRPRSGLAANDGVTVLNTPGTIDSDYRGEIKVILINLHTKKFFVERGMRIAQMIIKPVWIPDLEYVDTLDETDRGEGGFGSTGK
jgi:dUTP pyrophosphatase